METPTESMARRTIVANTSSSEPEPASNCASTVAMAKTAAACEGVSLLAMTMTIRWRKALQSRKDRPVNAFVLVVARSISGTPPPLTQTVTTTNADDSQQAAGHTQFAMQRARMAESIDRLAAYSIGQWLTSPHMSSTHSSAFGSVPFAAGHLNSSAARPGAYCRVCCLL